jgi:hypothetical protein
LGTKLALHPFVIVVTESDEISRQRQDPSVPSTGQSSPSHVGQRLYLPLYREARIRVTLVVDEHDLDLAGVVLP